MTRRGNSSPSVEGVPSGITAARLIDLIGTSNHNPGLRAVRIAFKRLEQPVNRQRVEAELGSLATQSPDLDS